ncbi:MULTISPECIES: hypothetical protein [unclassified Arthrobacter]|uniref:hypothetical protein n=1 Tax=unclassified Arthrobacter TaxID=235627 RepID=UPI001492F6AE|nr:MULTISPECIES: hypothetical protein [unclassified Arthrobacter]NOJ63405.1 hypothetical protein [Arthrobacter sp. 147(2020)]
MTEPSGIDMKLRAAFLLPTLIIGLALILVDVFVVDFMPSWLHCSSFPRLSVCS